MEKGQLAKLDITCLVLRHPPIKFETYEDEIQYLIQHEQRNNFLKNLALDQKGKKATPKPQPKPKPNPLKFP